MAQRLQLLRRARRDENLGRREARVEQRLHYGGAERAAADEADEQLRRRGGVAVGRRHLRAIGQRAVSSEPLLPRERKPLLQPASKGGHGGGA